jgi:hypothetical protein
MIEAASISETSINFYQTTRRNIPEDSHLLDFWSFPEIEYSPPMTAMWAAIYQLG